MLADAAVFPRDKTCGDGLTPRAIGELERLGLGDWLRAHGINQGLRATASAQTLLRPGPGGDPAGLGVGGGARPSSNGRASARAIKAGAAAVDGARAVDVRRRGTGSPASCSTDDGLEVRCRRLVVADGVRSPLGRCWAASGTATPSTAWPAAPTSPPAAADDPWITSHLELRGEDGEVLSGYGWMFPLGTARSTSASAPSPPRKRPADLRVSR